MELTIIRIDLLDLELTLSRTFLTLHHTRHLINTRPRASHLTMEGEEDGMDSIIHTPIKGTIIPDLMFTNIRLHSIDLPCMATHLIRLLIIKTTRHLATRAHTIPISNTKTPHIRCSQAYRTLRIEEATAAASVGITLMRQTDDYQAPVRLPATRLYLASGVVVRLLPHSSQTFHGLRVQVRGVVAPLLRFHAFLPIPPYNHRQPPREQLHRQHLSMKTTIPSVLPRICV